MRKRGRRVIQVCQGVVFQPVRAAREDDELRFEMSQMLFHPRPGLQEFSVAGSRFQRDIELAAPRRAFACFVLSPGPRIKVAAVLVDVGENEIRIFFIRIIDALAVVHIDIHIGNAPDAILRPQRFDHDAEIVEHAETRGMAASGVIQSADGLKAAVAFPLSRRSRSRAARCGARRTVQNSWPQFQQVRKLAGFSSWQCGQNTALDGDCDRSI